MFGSPPDKKATRRSVSSATDRFRRARRGNPKRFRQLFYEPLESRELLSTLTVTSASDSGAGSLRAMILAAAAGDAIQFDSSLAGQTIKLTSGILTISRPLTIQGLGAGQLTVDGKQGGVNGVLKVDAGVTAAVSGLTLVAGSTSAAIQQAGSLHVADCTISGNTGISFDGDYGGTLTVSHSIIHNSGSGIRHQGSGGTVTVTNSILSDSSSGIVLASDANASVENSTISGNSNVGIVNSGTLAITNSTISGNEGTWGGGIENYSSGSLTIINSTISENTATYGGGIYNSGSLIVKNSTIAQNAASSAGGGIYRNSGSVALANTIVANNANAASPDIRGSVTADYCLISNTAGATISGTPTNVLNLDPHLAWLGDYGGLTLPDGSSQQTMPLLVGSPAIDAGSNALIPSGFTTDQRGFARPVNGTVDIGACENHSPTLTPRTLLVMSTNDGGTGSSVPRFWPPQRATRSSSMAALQARRSS